MFTEKTKGVSPALAKTETATENVTATANATVTAKEIESANGTAIVTGIGAATRDGGTTTAPQGVNPRSLTLRRCPL